MFSERRYEDRATSQFKRDGMLMELTGEGDDVNKFNCEFGRHAYREWRDAEFISRDVRSVTCIKKLIINLSLVSTRIRTATLVEYWWRGAPAVRPNVSILHAMPSSTQFIAMESRRRLPRVRPITIAGLNQAQVAIISRAISFAKRVERRYFSGSV